MPEKTSEFHCGRMADALHAAPLPVVKWSAQEAGVEDISQYGLRGSRSIVKRLFAPSVRSLEGGAGGDRGEASQVQIKSIFKEQPKLESNLVGHPRRF
ncbi:hypothetical protein ACFFWD_31250 [Bradyrhizobium erythrophlei]|uniref:hypothetical protein n=1 Tax=Bradyrhizobium erythrophlei TaxID=1437360 RepID=UPI0035E77A0D